MSPSARATRFLEKQINDLARLYWRRDRLERSQTGLMRRALLELDARQHARRLEIEGASFQAGQAITSDLTAPSDPAARLRLQLSLLGVIREQVGARSFLPWQGAALEVFSKGAGLAAGAALPAAEGVRRQGKKSSEGEGAPGAGRCDAGGRRIVGSGRAGRNERGIAGSGGFCSAQSLQWGLCGSAPAGAIARLRPSPARTRWRNSSIGNFWLCSRSRSPTRSGNSSTRKR